MVLSELLTRELWIWRYRETIPNAGTALLWEILSNYI